MSDSTQYVRLIARPGTWYKPGTEVFWEDAVRDSSADDTYATAPKRRLTLGEWEKIAASGGIGCVGIRVCEDNPNERGMGCAPGDERWDGEWCTIDEFDVEITEEGTP